MVDANGAEEMASTLVEFFKNNMEAVFNVEPEDVEMVVPHDSKDETHWPVWLLKLDGEVVGAYDEVGQVVYS